MQKQGSFALYNGSLQTERAYYYGITASTKQSAISLLFTPPLRFCFPWSQIHVVGEWNNL